MEEVQYNKHYIVIDDQNRIVDGWSDGPHPDRDASGAICINKKGGYQFSLFNYGDENPVLFDGDDVPLYKWDGVVAVRRSVAEIAADVQSKFSPAKQRENAYNTNRIILWNGDYITVTEASQLWQYYSAEGSMKAYDLQLLIVKAKDAIREQYPEVSE